MPEWRRGFLQCHSSVMEEQINIFLAQPFKASPTLAAAATNLRQWTSVVAGGSPQELAFGSNNSHQESIPTPIFGPISANQTAYSNACTNSNASRGQSLSNAVRVIFVVL